MRSFTIVWDDLGRVKLNASDLVANEGSSGVGNGYAQLKPGAGVHSTFRLVADTQTLRAAPRCGRTEYASWA